MLPLLTGLWLVAACAPNGPDPTPPSEIATPTPPPLPTPDPTPAEPAVGAYLALGDSLAVGVGATQPERDGYVALIHAQLADEAGPMVMGHRIVELENMAVSGETSASMRDGGQLDHALELIATADPPVALVTLDIGGNDLLALMRDEPCASEPDSPACNERVRTTIETFEGNYRFIVASLVEAVQRQGHGTPVMVMTYFNPFSGTEHAYEVAGDRALLGGDGAIDCDAVEEIDEARGMNDVIACVGAALGGVVVDIAPHFAGRGDELTHIAEEDIHTNDEGHAALAQAFLDEIGGYSE
jgi:acyl-CoA thioesterase I